MNPSTIDTTAQQIEDAALDQAHADGAIGSPNTQGRTDVAASTPNRFYVEVPKACVVDYIHRIAKGALEKVKQVDLSQLDEQAKRRHFAMIHSMVVTAEFLSASQLKFAFEIPLQGKTPEEELAAVCEVNNALLEETARTLGFNIAGDEEV